MRCRDAADAVRSPVVGRFLIETKMGEPLGTLYIDVD